MDGVISAVFKNNELNVLKGEDLLSSVCVLTKGVNTISFEEKGRICLLQGKGAVINKNGKGERWRQRGIEFFGDDFNFTGGEIELEVDSDFMLLFYRRF